MKLLPIELAIVQTTISGNIFFRHRKQQKKNYQGGHRKDCAQMIFSPSVFLSSSSDGIGNSLLHVGNMLCHFPAPLSYLCNDTD